MQWSDGIDRDSSYRGTDLQVAIKKYFNDRMDHERLALAWDHSGLMHDQAIADEKREDSVKALAAKASKATSR